MRHLETAGDLLDPYFADPLIWHLEFRRVALEASTLAASSEGLEAPDRRYWTLREAATVMTSRADDERAEELRSIGETLVENARLMISQEWRSDEMETRDNGDEDIEPELATAMLWASCLDRDKFQVRETPDGLFVQPTPPEEVVQKLQDGNRDFERASEATRLTVRYLIKANEADADAIEPDELTTDLASARDLMEDPPTLTALHPLDVPALVASAALDAHLLRGVDLPDDVLAFAADTSTSSLGGRGVHGVVRHRRIVLRARRRPQRGACSATAAHAGRSAIAGGH